MNEIDRIWKTRPCRCGARRRQPAPRRLTVLLAAAAAVASSQEPPTSWSLEPFLQWVAARDSRADGLPSEDVRELWLGGEGRVAAATSAGTALFDGTTWIAGELATPPLGSGPPGVEVVATSTHDAWQVAAGPSGLFVTTREGEWRRLLPRDGRQTWAPVDVADVAFDRDGRLWFVSSQGMGRGDLATGEWRLWDPGDGLPFLELTAVAPGAEGGDVWLGSRHGVMHLDGETWEVRQGPRWLPDDDVRDLAIDATGTVFVATAAGIARLVPTSMTLAEKARRFEREIDRFHRRTPWGYVGSVHLDAPGDTSRVEQRSSDNDGLWTAMYGAGEAFAWAATRDPAARARARTAFEALRFLSEVTQGGEPAALPGFVARSILPTDGPDPNAGRRAADEVRRRRHDASWKVLEPRWGKSADGRWYWKADTSSDELDGHYFFYARYWDLVVDSEAERQEVRRVVRGLTDHLLEHDFALVDHDGLPTRWAVFSPSRLDHDVDWWEERGLNSLSILSYLRVASHVVGDPRYDEAAQRLIDEHAYHTNVRVPKIHDGPGTGNQSDDEMAFMAFYNLLRYERDPELRALFLHSFYRYWRLEAPERNPLFHFLYAAFGRGATYRDAFGAVSLDPGDFAPDWLADSVDTLERYPLDRIDWPLRNSHRLDVVLLRDERERGHRRDGKVLPIDERFVDKWNHDPWRLDHEGDGRTFADGASFLLPYYLGLYLGLLVE